MAKNAPLFSDLLFIIGITEKLQTLITETN